MTDNSVPRGWLSRLAGYCWRHRRSLVLSIGAAALATSLNVLLPVIERFVIDDAVIADSRPLLPLILALVLAAAGIFGLTFVRRYFGGRLAMDVQHDLRTDMFASLTRLDGTRQDELDTGQVVARSTTDLALVQGLLSVLPNLTGNVLLFVLSMVAMLIMSPLLTSVTLVVVPALWWLASRSRTRLFPATWYAQQRTADVAGVVEAAVTGVRVVKGFGQEDRELDRLDATATRLYAARMRAVRFTARYAPALQTVPSLGQVGVVALGGWLALRGEISLGTFLAFCTYLTQMNAPVHMLTGLLAVAQQARASVVRVFDVVDALPEVTERPGARELAPGPGAVELDGVTFGYLASEPVLRDVTLRVAPGETLALVGRPGSGKSTIAQLLPRFYDVQDGAVRIDGQDVRNVTIGSLRATIGVVQDESFLFSDTVAANIAYGMLDASRERIEAAARAAEADGFIRDLPAGYDTVVGERGLTLSGGQRQRIALARALLTDSRIVLLDDATSAVDARVEADIQRNLRRILAGRTTLLIAHRRSTLRLADRIAVLDAGRVAAVGTHDELVAGSPLYRELLAEPEPGATAEDPTPEPEPEPVVDKARIKAAKKAMKAGLGLDGSTGGGASALMSSMPATPQLVAQVAALPPADDTPEVPAAAARRAEPGFTLWRLLRRFRLALLVALLLVTADAGLALALPSVVRASVDNGVRRGSAATLLSIAAAGLTVVLAAWLVQVILVRVTGRTSERLLYTLRVKIFAQLQRLGLDYYEREMTGRIITRMTTDVDALSVFLQTGLVTAVVGAFTFVGIMVTLVVLDAQLALVVFIVLPPLFAATVWFRARTARAYRDAREKVGTVNAHLHEQMAGLRVAQSFRREDHALQRFASHSNAYRASRVRAQQYLAMYFPFVQFLTDVAAALALAVGAGRVHDGTLTVGALIAYLLYIDLFFTPIQRLSQIFDAYQQAVVALARIRELLATPTSTPVREDARPVPARLTGDIRLEGVCFTYPDSGRAALAGIDLHVPAGTTLALVGETGAGKSTLAKLLARYYDVSAGAILVDGADLRDWDLTGYRRRIGVVPQEAYLSAGTVRDAIAYGRPDATDAAVEEAARATGAWEAICRLPGGLEYPVGERGRNLSAGQRQLIALARAHLVDPDILLLDEATAALDLATEAAVTRAAQALARRRTTVLIAHRLSTAAAADRIVVLADGRIAECGAHEELLATGGRYAAMWAALGTDQAVR